ncbi:MAG: DUF3124 domain-containing protein [Terrimicrobiaceae bacterium]
MTRSLSRLSALALLVSLSVSWKTARAQDAAEPGPNGELIYVPIYSSIFYQDSKRTLELAATLSIHNVDPDHSLALTKVDYYNTKGELIRRYLEKPLLLKPLETKNFVIDKTDTTGGTGANFLVEWRAQDEAIVSPLLEAIMINVASSQSLSFTSQGKVIKRFGSLAKPSASPAP